MNPQLGNILLSLFVLVILIMLNAFFAMSEIAILQSNQNRIKKLAEEGNKKAKTLLRITAEPSDFLSTIQVGVTLSGFLASAVAADKFAGMLADALGFLPVSRSVTEGVSLVLLTLLLSYFTLVFGELVPKRIAMKSPDRLALRVGGILNGIYRVLKPVIKLLSASTNGVSRLFGIRPGDDKELVTEEDIILLAEEGEETGAIQKRETEMIHNIFEFDDKSVSEIMVHRVDMEMTSYDACIKDVLNIAKTHGFSRIPVYQVDADNIIGIIYIKDLIGLSDSEFENPILPYLRKPIYIPEGKLCSELLLEFQAHRTHIAIIIDEYGGTAGMVTLEDLLEIIVGEIEDESDPIEPPEIEQIGENYFFDGDVSLREVERTLHIVIADTHDCDTISGYYIALLGKIPLEPEQDAIQLSEEYWTIPEKIEERRIIRMRVFRQPE